MNDVELLDAYLSLQEDYNLLYARYRELKREHGYEIVDMHSRPVLRRPILDFEKHFKCPDCAAPGKYAIFEFSARAPQPAIWYWCGQCDIGG